MDGSVKPKLQAIEISAPPINKHARPATPPPPPTTEKTPTEDDLRSPFDSLTLPASDRIKQVWAVGGGKGGIGKSLIAANLAIALSRMGNKVIAIDLDLGGANLHTTLGVDLPKQTLGDFFYQRIALEQCTTPTGITNLDIISGAGDAVGIANLHHAEKARLFQTLRELDTDYVIFDLGAGTGCNTIDFFLYADIGIISMLPEPTSIENAYRFIKTAYYRKLEISRNLEQIRPFIKMAMDPKNTAGIKSPADLFRETNKLSPEHGMRLKEEIEKFRPKLIINQARTQTDVDIGFSVKTICKKYFGIEMDYVGYLDYESAAWQAIRRKRPLMLEFPNSKLVYNLERITQYLLKRHGHYKSDVFK